MLTRLRKKSLQAELGRRNRLPHQSKSSSYSKVGQALSPVERLPQPVTHGGSVTGHPRQLRLRKNEAIFGWVVGFSSGFIHFHDVEQFVSPQLGRFVAEGAEGGALLAGFGNEAGGVLALARLVSVRFADISILVKT